MPRNGCGLICHHLEWQSHMIHWFWPLAWTFTVSVFILKLTACMTIPLGCSFIRTVCILVLIACMTTPLACSFIPLAYRFWPLAWRFIPLSWRLIILVLKTHVDRITATKLAPGVLELRANSPVTILAFYFSDPFPLFFVQEHFICKYVYYLK